MSDDLPILNPAEARVLGSLIEKKELTPDVYPMTVNGLQSATNQKTSREPVMTLEQGDVHRALRLLMDKGLVRQVFASRVERYEHQLAQAFSLTQPQIALLGLMLLRGPQTAHELMARTERMARFQSIEQLRGDLDLLIGRRPPLVQLIERGPGQREERYAHLLSGEVQISPQSPSGSAPAAAAPRSDLEERVETLERQVAELSEKLKLLIGD
ncbi:YceH family protein [Mesorhizobium marinum]|uniref:YceH family protein n=1 Tax=Mesorhizobium marinum TaxID=3228790 RepID=UPI0034670E0A